MIACESKEPANRAPSPLLGVCEILIMGVFGNANDFIPGVGASDVEAGSGGIDIRRRNMLLDDVAEVFRENAVIEFDLVHKSTRTEFLPRRREPLTRQLGSLSLGNIALEDRVQ
jgi:hypothetical protein